ncbi:MAG TPA: TonB-dependent receptor plug domain-containing protein, partial [Chitinophagaceae bacterium]|nr:TonB-dependent receptor plug domain-containing protein [Chitinophagaceae bacterium]
MKCLLTCLLLCFVSVAEAQHVLKLIVKNEDNKGLPGATIRWTQGNRSVITDTTGSAVIENIPAGEHQFIITHIGYEEKEVAYVFPLPGERVIEIILEEAEEEHEEEILVTTTRISRTIANIPTRVEVISGEELTEKGNMRPGEIRMLLSESTGIQVQQTSATSFNAGIRIQGLDGRYTQMLRDGYPLYAGFAGGLSIMQIAPLDLRQVEVIKGSASTLYGGGAIAGLVNLISKTPGDERELSFLANGTSAGGLDLSAFYSERYGKAGLTVFASRNSNAPYDPADIGLTAIPKFERYTVNPRLFLYGSKTSADLGVTYITEDRTGGSMQYIKEGGAGYFEHNNTDRFITQLGISHRMNEKAVLQFKNSYSRFDRVITVPNYRFDALQQSSFSELTWTRRGVKADWVIGSNLLTEDLEEKTPTGQLPRNY